MDRDVGEAGAKWRRAEAATAFNRAWELLDADERGAAEDAAMLGAAFASRYLWETVGGDQQRAIGDWQIARVASELGYSELALHWATLALETVLRNGWTDWRLASCYEGMARAHASAGDPVERDRYARLCRDRLADIEDAEDRELIASQLATVPGVSDSSGPK
jgi:hypothetical protein